MVITQEKQTVTMKDFRTEQKSTWCPGCGDFGILAALQQALVKTGMAPHQVHLVSGIGCGSKLPDYMTVSGFMTLHGRGATVGCGAHLARPDLVSIVVGGDGDTFGIGIGHAIHNMRRNMDIVHIVENNEVYGLTKGQYSPTSKRGFITSTSPEGAIEFGINPGGIALQAGATFVAYGYSGDPKLTSTIIAEAMEHKGYALCNILQTCPSYNKLQTNDWFKEHMFKIEDHIPDYDPSDLEQAMALVNGTHPVWEKPELEGKLYPQGVVYKNDSRPTYTEQIPAYQANPAPITEHSLEVTEDMLASITKSYV